MHRAGWVSAGPGGELGDRRADELLVRGTPRAQARLCLPSRLSLKQPHYASLAGMDLAL